LTKPITARELSQLLDQHANPLRLFASQWSNSPDDCVQEALVELAAQREKPDKPVAWLYKVVRRRALNDLRGHTRRAMREKRVARVELSSPDPAEKVLRDEQQRQIQIALGNLPSDSRELIVLRIWSGLTWMEIGELTGCSTSAAQRRFVSALKLLKSNLETKCLTKPE
jgi:RNA polymerase sigma-70 factor (ECF subfamily)